MLKLEANEDVNDGIDDVIWWFFSLTSCGLLACKDKSEKSQIERLMMVYDLFGEEEIGQRACQHGGRMPDRVLMKLGGSQLSLLFE